VRARSRSSGELDIQDDQVVGIHVPELGTFFPVHGHIYGMTLLLEPLLKKSCRFIIVLYYENAHGKLPRALDFSRR